MKKLLRKYFIMGSQDTDKDPRKVLQQAISYGVTAFQFREKGDGALTGGAKENLCFDLREICLKNDIPFFVNDDVELASKSNADGIHVGQDDASVVELRERFPDKWIGLSISNEQELQNSPLHVIDYVGAGPVFMTTSKQDAKDEVGLEWIQTLRKKHPTLPIVGIGGIHPTNAATVIEAGADGVAVISAITKATDIATAIRAL